MYMYMYMYTLLAFIMPALNGVILIYVVLKRAGGLRATIFVPKLKTGIIFFSHW